MIRKVFVILWLVVAVNHLSFAQPLLKDTVICIIDTSRCFVEFRVKPLPDRAPELRWQLSIKGHYYDLTEYTKEDKDFACIVFSASSLSSVYGRGKFNGPFEVKRKKAYIKDRYIVVDEEWIHNQTDNNILRRKIGSAPFEKFNFVIFKSDFEKSENDTVIMHRVEIGYCEVSID